jgi:heat shock protein HslJ
MSESGYMHSGDVRISGLPMIAYATLLTAAVALGVALPAGAAELAGSEWRPIRIGGETWADETDILVRFASDGQLAGHTGCNRFMGRYALIGDSIEIGLLATTQMACPEPVMARERRFLAVLEGARRFARERTELTLADAKGTASAFLVQTDWD